MPYVAGFKFLSVEWLGPNAIEVRLDPGAYALGPGLPTGPRWQLYSGRTPIGESPSEQPIIIGSVPVGGAASPLSAIVVDATEAGQDFGHLLRRKPWSLYRITWPRVADSDCTLYEIVAGREPGEAYDLTNVIARVPHTAATSYTFDLPAFPDRGDWSIAVIARDNAKDGGNAGTPRVVTIPTLVYPPDFVLGGASLVDASSPDFTGPLPNLEAANRFEAGIVTPGVLDVSFEYGSVGQYP